jgi:peptidoglycan/LPS O-acetylase OafA/YrhL
MHKSNLDVLRALAVSCVLIHHLTLTLHFYTGFMPVRFLDYFRALGHAGVLAFFVHTSLVLMYSLERMHRAGGDVTFAFYIRRFFRIYPLAIFAILIALAFHFPSKTWENPDIITHKVIAANLLLVQNIFTKKQVLGPLWSLPYEVQMYVVLPALFLLARGRQAITRLLMLFGAFCALGVLIQVKTGHLNMAEYVPCFIAGVLCYALRNSIPQKVVSYAWMPFLLVLIAVFVGTIRQGDEPLYWSGWIYCLILGLAINLFRDSKVRLLNTSAEKIALYSYGIYLLHQIVLSIVFERMGIRNVALGSALFFGLTEVFAIAAFHFVESPLMDLGRKLSAHELLRPSPDPGSLEPAP